MVAIGGRAGGVGRVVTAALAAAAMGIGAVWFVGSSVLHDRVLDRRTYLDAFDEVDAYGRLYTDVLTDGPVRDATDRLFDGLAELGVDRQDGSAVANAALRLTLPPAVLREVAQAFVAGLLAYLRDDSASFEAFVPLDDILAHIDPAASELVEQAVAVLSQLLADHVDEIESFIRSAFDALADGEIPVMVPVVGGRKVAEEQLIAVLDGLPGALLPADVLDDVLAALDSSEHRDAFIAQALGSVRSSLHELGQQLATGDVEIDLIRVLVAVTGRDRAEVVAQAAHVKHVMAWAPSWSRYLGLALFLLGGAGLCRRRPRRAAVSLGVGVAAAGGAAAASWFVLSRLIGLAAQRDRPMRRDRQAVPDGAARLLADLDDVLLRELSRRVDAAGDGAHHLWCRVRRGRAGGAAVDPPGSSWPPAVRRCARRHRGQRRVGGAGAAWRGGGAAPVQRPRRAVRPALRRDRAGRHAQLDVEPGRRSSLAGARRQHRGSSSSPASGR